MSSIRFMDQDGNEARVGGAERGVMQRYVDGAPWVIISDYAASKLLPHQDWGAGSLGIRKSVAIREEFRPEGFEDTWWQIAINTALALGNDPVRLSARLHTQCEVHCWVDGQNRAWMADLIEEGLALGVMRTALQTQYGNWPAVLELLRSSDEGYVVTDYSVSDSWPMLPVLDHCKALMPRPMPDPDEDNAGWNAWHDELRLIRDGLTDDEREQIGLAYLRDPEHGLELRPDTLGSVRFGPQGKTAMDVLEAMYGRGREDKEKMS